MGSHNVNSVCFNEDNKKAFDTSADPPNRKALAKAKGYFCSYNLAKPG